MLEHLQPASRGSAGGYAWTGAQDPTLLDVLKCELLFIGATENVRGTPYAQASQLSSLPLRRARKRQLRASKPDCSNWVQPGGQVPLEHELIETRRVSWVMIQPCA